ncbi:WG repeat-containing protein [Flavobacterium sp.]|uniref:WG repeat-containing protein n=1 Tax=Flavobacterium sp. TaxID=239 RepID=UPI00286DD498|nr:WG repeat-containing protein [Flavobacterium sp.]
MKFLFFLIPFFSFCQSEFMIERAIPLKGNKNWGLCDKQNGKIIFEPKYDSIFYNYEKGFVFAKNNKYGIIDCSNYNNCKEILNPYFDNIYHTRKGYITEISEKKGFVNFIGETLLENKYDKIQIDNEYIFINNDKDFSSGVYDLDKKKFVVPLNYEIISIDFDDFWKSKEVIQKQALIKLFIFKNVYNKYYYLNINHQLIDLKLGIKFNENKVISEDFIDIQMVDSQKISFLKESKNNFDSYYDYRNRKKIKFNKINFYATSNCIYENVIISNKENSLFGVINKISDSIQIPPIL